MKAHDSNIGRNGIIGLFPQLLGIGGVQEAGRQTALALDQIARRYRWPLYLLSLNDAIGDQTVRVGECDISFHGFGRAKVSFTLMAVRLARRHDGIVLAAHPHLAIPARVMKSISRHLGTVVMSHGIEVWKPLSMLRRAALRSANLVLAPSSYTAQKLRDVQGISTGNLRTLPWPLDSNFLRMVDEPSSLPLPKSFPEGQVLLTVGRWAASERYKGGDELISTLAEVRSAAPTLHLVIVGSGDDLPRLQQMVHELGLNGSVSFLEGLSRKELAACYARADVFALPSTGEGFGLVFLEAMAFGKPVVGVDWGGPADLIENGVDGFLVPPNCPEKLREVLRRLLTDRSLRAKLGENGATTVRRKYQFRMFSDTLEQILRECGLELGSSV